MKTHGPQSVHHQGVELRDVTRKTDSEKEEVGGFFIHS